jgi:hypothetical protein
MTTTQIMASLDNKLLANADRYFTADLETLIDEIVQNARRAGATAIRFTRQDRSLVITDDGRGLTADKAPVLLRLGGSDNTDAVELDERAAGMGFFALARYGVSVRSHNWAMTITPAAFTAEEPAILTTGHPHQDGLTLTIHDLGAAKGFHNVIDGMIFVQATRYSGLRTLVAGCTKADGWYEPEVFLARSDAKLEQSASRRCHGVTIKVCRGPYSQSEMTVNFFGKVIRTSVDANDFPCERIAGFEDRNGTPTLVVRDYHAHVLVDVHDASTLKLQLPQRSSILKDEGFATICTAARELHQDILLTPDLKNGVPMTSVLRQGRGAAIPRPSVAVASGLQTENDYVPTEFVSHGDALLRSDGTVVPLSEVIAGDLSDYFISLLGSERASEVLGPHGILYEDNVRDAFGEGVYRRITGIGIHLRVDGDEIESRVLDPEDDGDTIDIVLGREPEIADLPSRLVDDIALALTIEGPHGSEELTVPVPVLFHCSAGDKWNPVVLLVGGGEDDVVSAMTAGIRWFSEKEDGDYDVAYENICDRYNAIVAKIEGKSHEAFLGDLSEQVSRLIRRHFVGDEAGAQRFSIALSATITENGVQIENPKIEMKDLAA